MPRDGGALELGLCCTRGEAAARVREGDCNSGHLLMLSILIITLPVIDFVEIREELSAHLSPKVNWGCTTWLLLFFC